MPGIGHMLKEAHLRHQQGCLDEAEMLYEKVLSHDKKHAEVEYLYGALKLQRGDLEAAISHSGRAVKLQPDHAGALSNLGLAYAETDREEQAIDCYRKALDLDPRFSQAHFNLARLLYKQGEIEQAIFHFKKAADISPDHYPSHALLAKAYLETGDYENSLVYFKAANKLMPHEAETHHNISIVLRKMGRLEEALAYSDKALEIDATYYLAHNTRGLIYNDLGITREAEACFKRALEHNPRYVDPLSNLAGIYGDLERYDDAFELLEKAYAENPRHVETLVNLGACYRDIGKLEKAKGYFQQALEISPEYFAALSNLAEVCCALKEHENTIELSDKILSIYPDNPAVRWNRAFSYLSLGRLKEGWSDYEFRQYMPGSSIRNFPYKRWDGQDLTGKTILIHAEQGLGDEIMFASCYQEVIQSAEKCIIDCDPRLVSLFKRSFPLAVVHGGRPNTEVEAIDRLGPVDYQIPAGSLPKYLRPEIGSFPAANAYLVPDQERTREFRARLQRLGPGLKVGICWRSGRQAARRNYNYTSLDQWGPILRVPGVQFINLQYDDCKAELDEIRKSWDINVHVFEDLDLYNDLDGVESLIDSLDLVITVGTAVMPLAASLGKPVWLMCLKHAWTGFGADRHAFFPSVQPYSRYFSEGWGNTIEAVANDLAALARDTSLVSGADKQRPIEPEGRNSIDPGANCEKSDDQITLQQCREGLLLFDAAAGSEGQSLRHYGEYACNEMGVLQQVIHEGSVVLELSAGQGITTLKFSQLVGSIGFVISLEADRLLFQRLCANLALNGIGNVHAYQMNVAGSGGGEKDKESTYVDNVSVDDLDFSACDLLCIHAAASTMDILPGAAGTLERYKPFIYIRNIDEALHREIERYMGNLGYSCLAYEIGLYNHGNFMGNGSNIFEGKEMRCLLCVPTPQPTS